MDNRQQIDKRNPKRAVTRIPLKTGGELRYSGRVSSLCSTSDIRRVNLVIILITYM